MICRFVLRRFVLSVVFLLYAGIDLSGQDDPVERIRLEHARHTFKHGVALPTKAASEDRFSTSRPSEISLVLPDKGNESFVFAVLGDRTGGQDSGVSVLADAVHSINLLEPDLVMNIGDMVQGYNATEAWLRQADEYKRILSELKSPWFPAAGNHDVYWSGPNRPKFQHEENYERHFGPLWYAFEHKNCRFIVLYTDEGHRETGEKNFMKPDCQKMSEEQFDWLKTTLEKAGRADHIFVFQHQPRWQNKGSYGNDWDRVHQLFVESGKVSAVFAGHTHTMRYEKRDGVEYFTLSTTGGRFDVRGVPRIGYRDNYLLVNVRKDRFGVASLAVADAVDPRALDPVSTGAIRKLQTTLRYAATKPFVKLAADGSVDTTTTLSLINTTPFPVDIEAKLDSRDSRWELSDYPQRIRLESGAKHDFEFKIVRLGQSADRAFRMPFVRVDVKVQTPGMEIAIPTQDVQIPVDLKTAMQQHRMTEQTVLQLGQANDVLMLPSIDRLDGLNALTLETWVRTNKISGRQHLISKGRSADLALSLNDGRPELRLPLPDNNVRTFSVPKTMPNAKIEADRWYHVAGVFDGWRVRLYLDGRLLVDEEYSAEKWLRNNYPFVIGAGVDRDGNKRFGFFGELDSVRFSDSPRYEGERFEPRRDFEDDDQTLFLLDMQETIGKWLPVKAVSTKAEAWEYGRLEGDAKIVPMANVP